VVTACPQRQNIRIAGAGHRSQEITHGQMAGYTTGNPDRVPADLYIVSTAGMAVSLVHGTLKAVT